MSETMTPITSTAAEMTTKLREVSGNDEAEVGCRGPNVYIGTLEGVVTERALDHEEQIDGFLQEVIEGTAAAKKAAAEAPAKAAAEAKAAADKAAAEAKERAAKAAAAKEKAAAEEKAAADKAAADARGGSRR